MHELLLPLGNIIYKLILMLVLNFLNKKSVSSRDIPFNSMDLRAESALAKQTISIDTFLSPLPISD